MRLLVAVLALCIACAVAHAQWSTGFDFVGNATDGENDPMGLLNYRYLQCLHCIDSRASYLRSLRSNDLDEPSSGAVDTLGALFSYGAIPSTFLAFWDRPAPWSNYSSETSSAVSAIASAIPTLVERNRYGNIVRSFQLAQASSTNAVGLEWFNFYGSNADETLRWLELNTSIVTDHHEGQMTFRISIIQFTSAIRGKIDLGYNDISPRIFKTSIKITGYRYLDLQNTLSIRVLCGYGSSSYSLKGGQISSGNGIGRVFVNLDETAQLLTDETALDGTPENVSHSDWQISPGLRNAISSSPIGNMLTAKFGPKWDVRFADVTFADPSSMGPQHILYTISTGNGFELTPAPEDTTAPKQTIRQPQYSSSPSSASTLRFSLSCILLFALFALFF